MNWRIVFAITRKDLAEVVKNSYIFVSMLMPFMLWAIFTFVINFDQADTHIHQNLFIMFVILSLGMTGSFVMPALLVEEREKRTLHYLLTTPAGILDILLAKILVSLVFGATTVLVLLLLERIQIGNVPAALLLLLLGSLFMTTIGLLMGSVFSTMQQVNTWATIVVFLLIAPSWFASVNSQISENIFFKFLPTYYMMRGLSLAMSGESWGNIATDLLILAGSVIFAVLLASWILEGKRKSNTL